MTDKLHLKLRSQQVGDRYVENKTNTKAVITADGDEAPYNGEPEYSLNTAKAEKLGFKFSNLNDWIFDLLDYYIYQVKCNEK